MAQFIDLTGQKFGMLTVLERAETQYSKSGQPIVMWKCKCDCGNYIDAAGGKLRSGQRTTCGCKKNKEQDLVGKRYGKLTVLKRYGGKSKKGILNWECLCDCGNVVIVSTKNLQRKQYPTISCGCTRNEHKDLIGERFGKLVVTGRADDYVNKSGNRFRQWICLCDCGNVKIVKEVNLRNGKTSHCGCETRNITSKSRTFDLTGSRFGKLVAIELSKTLYSKSGRSINYWKCLCDCGNYTEVAVGHLMDGHTKSCGCLMDKNRLGNAVRKHGMVKSKIYLIYASMKQRCLNPNNLHYKDYGARGISICDEWLGEHGFENFVDWAYKNGYDEAKSRNEQSIDRIDVNGNYEPSNCRWATMNEQMNNQRKTIKVEYNGAVYSLTELSELVGIKKYILYYRIRKQKMNVNDAIKGNPKGLK